MIANFIEVIPYTRHNKKISISWWSLMRLHIMFGVNR